MPHIDLLELPYFQDIAIDELVALVDTLSPACFAPGETIVEEGADTPPRMHIGVKGRIALSKKRASGEIQRLAELQSPTLFGEIELICQMRPVSTAVAIDRVETYVLDHPTLTRLLQQRLPAIQQFVFNVARVACHRLAIADEMLMESLYGQDLVALRADVHDRTWSKDWLHTTGAFRRPGLRANPAPKEAPQAEPNPAKPKETL